MDKITDNLNKIIEANGSARACNTLAEFNHAQAGSQNVKDKPENLPVFLEKSKLAAKYYMSSAE